MRIKCSNNSYFIINKRNINKVFPFELFENQENTMEDKTEFLNKFDKILLKICTLESQKNIFDINLIKYLIVFNKEKEFLY